MLDVQPEVEDPVLSSLCKLLCSLLKVPAAGAPTAVLPKLIHQALDNILHGSKEGLLKCPFWVTRSPDRGSLIVWWLSGRF